MQLKSKLEVLCWKQLKGKGWKYEHVKIPYLYPVRNGVCANCSGKMVNKRRVYNPDFSKGTCHIEAKGKLDAAARQKLISIKQSNPGLDLRIVLQCDNWTTRKHTQRYSDWCRKHGFPVCVKVIPVEWTK